MPCQLLALNRQTLSAVECPLLDKSGQSGILARDDLSANNTKATFRSVAGSNDGLRLSDCLGLWPFSMES